MPRKHRVKDDYKTIAVERIERLFELADETFDKNQALANRYVKIAWRIATKYNIRIPAPLKRKFCRECLSFFRPGVSCRVRIQSGCVVVTCLRCGRVTRLPHRPKRTQQKK